MSFYNMKNPILITGSTRSGTTFLGRTIASDNNMIYLWEPFQVGLKERNSNGVFDYWFEYLDDETDKKEIVLSYLERCSKLNKNDLVRLRTKNLERIRFETRNTYKKLLWQLFNKPYRIILKDPIALFSAEWLYRHLDNLKVIVMIRNPVSVIKSYKRLEWDIGFSEFQRQEKLLTHFPQKYVSLVHHYGKDTVDIIDKGILFWNLIYYKVLEYKKKYENQWKFIKLEDIVKNPTKIMNETFEFCNLPLNEKILFHKSHWFENASKNKRNNDNILTEKEIDKIISNTYDIAKNFGYFCS